MLNKLCAWVLGAVVTVAAVASADHLSPEQVLAMYRECGGIVGCSQNVLVWESEEIADMVAINDGAYVFKTYDVNFVTNGINRNYVDDILTGLDGGDLLFWYAMPIPGMKNLFQIQAHVKRLLSCQVDRLLRAVPSFYSINITMHDNEVVVGD